MVGALNCSDKNQLADTSKGAIFARGGVFKHTLVVDNDRQCTCTYIHSCLKSFSPAQVYYQSLSSDTDAHSVNGCSRKRFTAYDTQSYYFIFLLFSCFFLSLFFSFSFSLCSCVSRRDIVNEGRRTTLLQTLDLMRATRLPYLRVFLFGHRRC